MLEAITGPDAQLRRAALEALRSREITPRLAGAAASALQDPKPEMRGLALRVLERVPHLAPIEALEAAALDWDPAIRAGALAILGRTNRASVLTTIQERLSSETEDIVVDAGLVALGQLLQTAPRPFPSSTLDAVCRAVGGVTTARRSRHRAELGLIARVVREDDLVERLASHEDDVRAGAAALAIERGTGGSLEALARLTTDAHMDVRDLAADASLRIQQGRTCERMLAPGFDVARYGRRATDVAGRSAIEMEPTPGPRTPGPGIEPELVAEDDGIGALLDALDSPQPEIRARGEEALDRIDAGHLGDWAEGYLEDAQPGRASRVAGLVAGLGRSELIPYLLRALLELPPGGERSEVTGVLAPFDETWNLIDTLQADDAPSRRVKGIQLAQLIDRNRREPLLRALDDTQTSVRLVAIEGIEQVAPGEVASRLLEIISTDPSARARVASVTRFRGAETSLRTRAADQALRSHDRAARVAAVELLSEGSDEELGLLARALHDHDLEVARKAIAYLGSLGAPEALAILWSSLRMAAPQVQEPILRAMEEFDREAVVFLGRQSLDSPDPADRVLGLSVLARLEEGTNERLLMALDDPSPEVRTQALETIRSNPSPAAVIAVGTRLRDPEAPVRLLALEVLEAIEDDRTLPYFVDGAKDPSPEVRRAAKDALLRHSSDAVIDLLLRALAFPSHRRAAADILIELGRPAVTRLTAALRDAKPEAGNKIGEILREGNAAPVLIEELSNREPDRRLQAVAGLGAMMAVESVPALIERLHDPDATVRATTARVLGSLGDVGAVEPLKAAFISDPDMEVVRAIEPALRRLTGGAEPPAVGNSN